MDSPAWLPRPPPPATVHVRLPDGRTVDANSDPWLLDITSGSSVVLNVSVAVEPGVEISVLTLSLLTYPVWMKHLGESVGPGTHTYEVLIDSEALTPGIHPVMVGATVASDSRDPGYDSRWTIDHGPEGSYAIGHPWELGYVRVANAATLRTEQSVE